MTKRIPFYQGSREQIRIPVFREAPFPSTKAGSKAAGPVWRAPPVTERRNANSLLELAVARVLLRCSAGQGNPYEDY
jgi:hypothetical protein